MTCPNRRSVGSVGIVRRLLLTRNGRGRVTVQQAHASQYSGQRQQRGAVFQDTGCLLPFSEHTASLALAIPASRTFRLRDE